MSSDFAFSETTPLRETDCSNAISTASVIVAVANSRNINGGGSGSGGGGSNNNISSNTSSLLNCYTQPTDTASAAGGGGATTNNINHNNNNNINRNNNLNHSNSLHSTGNSLAGTPTGATIQVETGVNSNYNGFSNRILHRNTYATNNNNNNGGAGGAGLISKMDTNRKIVRKIALDFALILCVGLPILCFFLFVEPYKRGFFCDDESLKHPFHDSTVKNYMLYIIGLVLPLCIIIPIEFYHGQKKSMPTYRFMDFDLSSWIVESYKQVGIFAFGAGSQQLVVDIAKYSVGRLRPHFIDVCQPIMPDGTKCDNEINFGRYIEEFTCEAHNSTPRMIKDMRLSFPSGHASFSAFTMIYCMLYLQAKMNWRGSKLFKHFLQLVLFSITWFTALSRISDYKHHWSDVLAGGVIGIVFAVIVSQWVADFNERGYQLPRTRNDLTSPTTNVHQTTTTTPAHQQYTNHSHQQQNHQNATNGHNNNNNRS